MREEHGPADLILANNVYAHISDIKAVTRAIKTLLAFDGVFVFEVHYLGNIIADNQYDMIYHEHIYYYSISSLIKHFKRHAMSVFDVKRVRTHGGSLRVYVTNTASKRAKRKSPTLLRLIEQERKENYHDELFFSGFVDRINSLRKDLLILLENYKKRGKTIAGYGASGRANTILQFCGIDGRLLDYMIDDAPAKHGLYTPGTHLEIKSSEALSGDLKPDIVVIFAWSFKSEIMNRHQKFLENGGSFVIPLPKIDVIEAFNWRP